MNHEAAAMRDAVEMITAECLEYSGQAPTCMSRFQIERFLVGTQPPSERFFTCCTEIRARMSALNELKGRLGKINDRDDVKLAPIADAINSITSELNVFKSLAEKWRHATNGRSYEDLQDQIWDERLSYRLCLSWITNQGPMAHAAEIMAMPDGARCKKLFAMMCQGSIDTDEAVNSMVKKCMADYEISQPAVGGEVDAPKLK